MKLSISNISWPPEYDNEIYKFISNLGFTGLEIAPTRLFSTNPYENLKSAKEFSAKIKSLYNLEICSMQSILYGKSEQLFGTDVERNELLNYLKKAIDFASAINCHNLVFGSPINRIIREPEQYPISINFFKELGKYAQQNNTVLSIEANPKIYNTNFINTTNEAFQLVKEVNSQGFAVNVDFGTIIQNKEDIDLIINNIMYVNHIHISEPNLNPIIIRTIHKDFATKLNKTSFKKFISIEMKAVDDIDKIKSIIRYIKKTFNENK